MVFTINAPPRGGQRGLTLTLVGLLALALSGCGAKHDASGQGGLLRVGFIGNTATPSGPEGWEIQRGRFLPTLRPVGVTHAQFFAFPNGPDLNEAMAAGALDVGMLGDTPAIVAHAAGLPARAINQTQVGMNAWLIVRADGPKTVAELQGKTVATQKGSYMARYLLGLLAQNGLTDRVRFVHLASSAAEPALHRGDIAAYAAPAGTGPLLLSHGFRAIDQAAQHPGLTGSGVTVVSEKYLAAHPNFPSLWNKARADAIADVRARPEPFYQFQAQAANLPEPIVKASYPVSLYSAQPFTPKGLALLDGTKAFLLGQHLAKSDFTLASWTVPVGRSSATEAASLPHPEEEKP